MKINEGYTNVPNSLIDKELPNLTCSELKVLLVVMRKTFGWHRQTEAVSFSRMEKMTGMSRGQCCDAVKLLESKGLLDAYKQSSEEYGKCATVYEVHLEDAEEVAATMDTPYSVSRTPPIRPTEHPIRPTEQYKEERKQSEDNKELKETLPTLSENLSSQEDSPEKTIQHWNTTQGKGLLGGKDRRFVHEEWSSLCELSMEGRMERILKRRNRSTGIVHRRDVSTPKSTFSSSKQNFPQKPVIDMAWKEDSGYIELLRLRDSITDKDISDADRARGFITWKSMNIEEKTLSYTHIIGVDPEYMPRIYNYLEKKEYQRKPRLKAENKISEAMRSI